MHQPFWTYHDKSDRICPCLWVPVMSTSFTNVNIVIVGVARSRKGNMNVERKPWRQSSCHPYPLLSLLFCAIRRLYQSPRDDVSIPGTKLHWCSWLPGCGGLVSRMTELGFWVSCHSLTCRGAQRCAYLFLQPLIFLPLGSVRQQAQDWKVPSSYLSLFAVLIHDHSPIPGVDAGRSIISYHYAACVYDCCAYCCALRPRLAAYL